MKLTEPKILSWELPEKLEYVFSHKGKKLMRVRNNNPLDKSKDHLGIIESQIKNSIDSPTYKERPHGK